MKKSEHIFWEGTLAEMIDQDILDHGIGREGLTDGFTLGKKGRRRFYMWDPTPNGYYKLYVEENHGVIGARYVDASKTMVQVWKKI